MWNALPASVILAIANVAWDIAQVAVLFTQKDARSRMILDILARHEANGGLWDQSEAALRNHPENIHAISTSYVPKQKPDTPMEIKLLRHNSLMYKIGQLQQLEAYDQIAKLMERHASIVFLRDTNATLIDGIRTMNAELLKRIKEQWSTRSKDALKQIRTLLRQELVRRGSPDPTSLQEIDIAA